VSTLQDLASHVLALGRDAEEAAHELNHSRGFLKGYTGQEVTEEMAYASEDALRAWIEGYR